MLRVDLADPAAARVEEHRGAAGLTARAAAWGGSGLALALALEGEGDPLVLAVGDAVRRGLATAERLAVCGRGPLTGLWAEGQVGGELAPRLASVVDAVAIFGRSPVAGATLVIEEAGRAHLAPAPPVGGAGLRTGPAAAAGVRFAGLVAQGDPESFTGRGGLGAAFADRGLAGVRVLAAPAPASPGRGLAHLLSRSPRLEARSDGGTLELFDAFAARGDLDADTGARIADEARAAGRGRKGCRGCPTPCGWVFETGAGGRGGAHFGAALALGPALGLESFEDAHALIGACDAAGIDAREMGAVLALHLGDTGEAPALERLLELVAATARVEGEGARLARGASALARELGLEEELVACKGQAARRETEPAAVLGQCVATGGSDPMRAFPFTASGDEVGLGRRVWWHENLAAALDATGFCAFSAGGLLLDRLVDLDELAGTVAPPGLLEDPGFAGLAPGERLLAAGATLVGMRRELNARWGAAEDQDRPPWAAEVLDRPGALDEYRVWRGIDAAGRLTESARAELGTPAVVRSGSRAGYDPLAMIPGPKTPIAAAPQQRAGRVRLVGAGPLADALGASTGIELPLPADVRAVLAAAAKAHPAAARLLLDGERVVPAVFRGGARLASEVVVQDGDELRLVVAIAGG